MRRILRGQPAILGRIMNMKMADDKLMVPALYDLSIRVVFEHYIHDDVLLDISSLPGPVTCDLMRRCLENSKLDASQVILLCKKMDVIVWIRLLKVEGYRKTVLRFYQRLINWGYPIGREIIDAFIQMCLHCIDWKDDKCITKHINYGLILGSFLSEASWYEESEQILYFTKGLCHRLSRYDVSYYKIQLDCRHRLFHTLTMYFKFDSAAYVYDEITRLLSKLEEHGDELDACGEYINYALLYTEFSRYNFFKNNYEESYRWIRKAMRSLHDKVAVPTVIQVLRQAAKVFVVKRDLVNAKYLIHQALARAEQHYGSGYYKLAGLLLDFGFYLLNSDHIEPSVSVYEEAYRLRKETFGSEMNNLHVAIAEEDLAYALYVKEYSSGMFDAAMRHAKQAIKTMKKLLPSGNLMLASANRVKALILEEMALDSYRNPHEEDADDIMLKKAEELHQEALSLTKDTFGEENILTAKHYGNLGRLYQSMQKFEEAERMHLKAIQIKEKILGPNDYEVGLSVGHLASLYNYHMDKYQEAEELYHRSININLKLFSESYSGLEYDYRGLIHVYEHLGDDEQYLKFSNKLLKWNTLRSRYVSDKMGSDFYKILKIEPLHIIVNVFEVSTTSVANDESAEI